MTRFLIALAAFGCLSAPAFADACSAASEAATRSALNKSEASGRRTATVRVTCEGERQTLVLHRVESRSGTTVFIREVKKSPQGQVIDVTKKGFFNDSSPAKLIFVPE